MTEQEYKAEWLSGLHHTEYNNCRFAEDKIQYAKDWLSRNKLVDKDYNPCTNFIANLICTEKLHIATDEKYCDLCTRWTDKIQVQEELKKLGLEDLLLDSVCKYSELTITDIEQNKQNLMIKCNHGSNWNVEYLQDSNVEQAVQQINNWQKLNYAYMCGYEAQYEHIKPGFVIQQLLLAKPLDYNFWCIDGDVVAVGLTKKLDNDITEHVAFTDVAGKRLDWYVGAKPEMNDLQNTFKKNINVMLPYVKEIAKLFKFVRVDMFTVDEQVKFEEATFTPCGGKIIIQNSKQ